MKPFFRPFLLTLVLAVPLVAAQPVASWTPVVPEDKAFSILFPMEPTRQTEKLKTPTGTIEVISYALKPKKDRPAYLLSFSEFVGKPNKETAQKRLDKARDSALASTKGKLQSQKKLTLHENPGLDLLILTRDNQHLHTRIFVVNNRLYQLFVVGTAEQVSSQDAAKFLDSFKLKLMK